MSIRYYLYVLLTNLPNFPMLYSADPPGFRPPFKRRQLTSAGVFLPGECESMNILERTLIEKTGADNGWECVLESSPDLVRLASARHDVVVEISDDEASPAL